MLRSLGLIVTVIGASFLSMGCAATAASDQPNGPAAGDPQDGRGPSDSTSSSTAPGDAPTSTAPKLTLLPSAKASQIATGRLHACALTQSGSVRCWGYSDFGQLGDGRPFVSGHDASSSVPVQVVGLTSGVKQIATYNDTTCALTTSGGVKCWGDDSAGQLGTGVPYTDNRKRASSTPVDVAGLASGVTQIAVGEDSTCAVLATGKVKCWGHDEYGKLGNDSTKSPGDGQPDVRAAVDVVGLDGVKQVTVGTSHACALTNADKVFCWGSDTFGQLGLGDTSTGNSVKTPVEVTALGTEVASIHAGARNTCARLKDGTAKCWGTTEWGSVGNGKIEIIGSEKSPVPVLDLTSVTALSSPDSFVCAVTGGLVKCWGESSALGTAAGSSYRTYKPADPVVGLRDVVEVGVGTGYACARKSDGAVMCWGEDGGGQLGDGKGAEVNTYASSDVPVAVASLP